LRASQSVALRFLSDIYVWGMWTLSLWDGFISKRRQVVSHALSLHHHLNGKKEALSPVLLLAGLSKFSGCAIPPTIVHYTVIPHTIVAERAKLTNVCWRQLTDHLRKKNRVSTKPWERCCFFQGPFSEQI
jgi:hypothetical protein